MTLNDYEQQLLAGWEEVYKKGQLTMWIMLALKDGPKHMAQVRDFILAGTNAILTVDDKSLYRALRRYYDVELVDFTTEPVPTGPDRKIYHLTPSGARVLEAFLQRNVVGPLFQPATVKLIKGEIAP